MSISQGKIELSLQRSKLLKIVLFAVGSVFFATANAVDGEICKPEDGVDGSYFLDVDDLEPCYNSYGAITNLYTEKNDIGAVWVFRPVRSYMRDGYRSVASVVAANLHKEIDERSLVPVTKFLIEKNGGDCRNYRLLGSVYKKDAFATSVSPIAGIVGEIRFGSDIFKNNNVENSVGIWSHLGLPISPNYALLAVSEDNKLIRYDYENSFKYEDPEIGKECFCTSDFLISEYECNMEYIKEYRQELFLNYEKAFKEIILKIRDDSRKRLEENDYSMINQALDQIIDKKKAGMARIGDATFVQN